MPLLCGRSCVLLLAALCSVSLCEEDTGDTHELHVDTLVKPEICELLSAMGDTLHIHYTGKLMDGKVIDTSLSREPLVVELGKRTVIAGFLQVLRFPLAQGCPNRSRKGRCGCRFSIIHNRSNADAAHFLKSSGLEQSLVGVCAGQKIKATIPAHLAYGKKGYPPTIPGDAVLEFEVEVISLLPQTQWQKMVNQVFPLVCLLLVPTLLGLVGLYLYTKANAQGQKKKNKEKKSKKK